MLDSTDGTLQPVKVEFVEDTGYVVARLNVLEYGHVEKPVRFHGVVFAPKDELHISICSRGTAARLARLVAGQPQQAAAVREAIQETDWAFRKLAGLYHIVQEEGIESIIQRVEVPGLDEFYQSLSRLAGHGFVLPPAHVTLYTRGTKKGIGIPTNEDFERMNRGMFYPDELDFSGQEIA